MAAPPPQTDPKTELDGFLVESRHLRDEYETFFEAYKSKSALDQFLGALGVAAAYDYFDIPQRAGSTAVQAFLKKWEATPEYRSLRTRFETHLHRVRTYLNGVSQNAPSLRPPGNSQRLLTLLRPVGEAKRLYTKMVRLVSAVEDIGTRPLVYNAEIPVRKIRPHTARPRKAATSQKQTDEALAWTLVVAFLTLFLAVTFGLVFFLGWVAAILVGFFAGGGTVIVLASTQRHWIPMVTKLLGRAR